MESKPISKADQFLMEIAVGKGIMRKLPSYIKHNKKSDCEKTVAEEVLFDLQTLPK